MLLIYKIIKIFLNDKNTLNKDNLIYIISIYFLALWGLGIGDWGLGIGDWGLGAIPNPRFPIPNPQSPINILILFN